LVSGCTVVLEALRPELFDLEFILGHPGLVVFFVLLVAACIAHPSRGLDVELVEAPAQLVLLHEVEHLDLDDGGHIALHK
jgi:hypothetical protein